MSAVVMVWSAVAAIVATLGSVHVAVWLHDRKAWANLMFSMSAFAVAAVAMCELALMHTESIPEYAAIMRWGQVPIFFLQTGILMFVALQYRTGRRGLAWAATVARFIVVVLGFFVGQTLQFRSIDALKQISLFGEKVWIVDQATTNPWNLLGLTAGLLALAFVIQATLTLWRRGGAESRRRAFVSASVVLYFTIAVGTSSLINMGVIKAPYFISFPFLAIIVTMGVELSRDVIRAGKLAEESRVLREDLAHVARVSSLTELSGSLAHELNQPLAIILSNAQAAQRILAKEPPNMGLLREILDDIVAEDQRAGEVIKRLRSLLKRGQFEPAALSLHEAIEEVLRLLHGDLMNRGVTVARALAEDLPPVLGDRVQLQQVILNLIANGADAMTGTEGERRLQLETMRYNGVVRVSVRDRGCGLPEDVERLFAPFHTTKPHGLGMGLAICRSIVDAHSGRLWAEPNAERGAVFHLELPVHQTEAS